jgi:hypothetical protein
MEKKMFKIGSVILVIGFAIAMLGILGLAYQTNFFLFLAVLLVGMFVAAVSAVVVFIFSGYKEGSTEFDSRMSHIVHRANVVQSTLKPKTKKVEKNIITKKTVA